jgi:putative ABC transport system substrate-binding protein
MRLIGLAVVLAVGLAIAPLAADAQQAGKVPRIGFLSVTSPSDRPPLLDAFRQGLRERRYCNARIR